jgi:hypothetical protein
MAQPSGSHSTYDAIGNREDLSDFIYDISPTKTPVLTMIGKGRATGTKHEWQKNVLTAASGANFVIEGDDATTNTAEITVRVNNYCAISDQVARVTGTQEAVDSAGRQSEMGFQMEGKMKVLKTDLETILLQNNAAVAGTDTAARESAGLQAFVKTCTDIASDATASAGDGTDEHTDGTARAVTESMVEGVLATAWTNGGEPSYGIMGAFQKRKFANFSGNSTRNIDASSKKLINSVDVYIDPLGSEVQIVPDHFAPVDVMYFIDPDQLKFATLRDFSTTDLAKTGDSERKQILVEGCLEVGNEAAHAGVYDLSSS